MHVPLITQPDGHKLGKSYRSPPLTEDQAPPLLLRALRALGQKPPADLDGASVAQIMAWGMAHWDAALIPRTLSVPEAQLS